MATSVSLISSVSSYVAAMGRRLDGRQALAHWVQLDPSLTLFAHIGELAESCREAGPKDQDRLLGALLRAARDDELAQLVVVAGLSQRRPVSSRPGGELAPAGRIWPPWRPTCSASAGPRWRSLPPPARNGQCLPDRLGLALVDQAEMPERRGTEDGAALSSVRAPRRRELRAAARQVRIERVAEPACEYRRPVAEALATQIVQARAGWAHLGSCCPARLPHPSGRLFDRRGGRSPGLHPGGGASGAVPGRARVGGLEPCCRSASSPRARPSTTSTRSTLVETSTTPPIRRAGTMGGEGLGPNRAGRRGRGPKAFRACWMPATRAPASRSGSTPPGGVAGFDLCFCAPKSVSVAWAPAPPSFLVRGAPMTAPRPRPSMPSRPRSSGRRRGRRPPVGGDPGLSRCCSPSSQLPGRRPPVAHRARSSGRSGRDWTGTPGTRRAGTGGREVDGGRIHEVFDLCRQGSRRRDSGRRGRPAPGDRKPTS